MRSGHSARVSYDQLLNKFGSYSNNAQSNTQLFCQNVLLSVGCSISQLKFGRTQIFLRSKKEQFVKELLSLDDGAAKGAAKYAERAFYRRQKRILRIRITFIGKLMSINKNNKIKNSALQSEQNISKRNEDQENDSKQCNIDQKRKHESEEQDENQTPKRKKPGPPKGKPKRKKEERPRAAIRYDGNGHSIKRVKSRQRCKLESCGKKSSNMCEKCNVHLCDISDRNCFDKFHTMD